MTDDDRSYGHTHDVIVVGGSAGAVEAVSDLVAGLPPSLPAAVCVVIHQPAYQPSRLAEILGRSGPLRAVPARNDAPLRRGMIHVAVPDHHLLVARGESDAPDAIGVLRLTHGPKENRARPAVDPLFRSAALAFGPRVIGVVLSGALDDGTAGLWAVRDRGGIAIVQDPDDAGVASMPLSALAEVGADHAVPASALGALLGELARVPVAAPMEVSPRDEGHAELVREVRIAAVDEDVHQQSARYGVPSRFSCPDCGGVLWDTSHGRGPRRFRCETGHAFTPASLAEMQTESVEEALWAALRALEDKAELARVRASGANRRGFGPLAARLLTQSEAAQAQAAAIRAVLRLDGRAGIRPEVPASDESALGGDRPRVAIVDAERPVSAAREGSEEGQRASG